MLCSYYTIGVPAYEKPWKYEKDGKWEWTYLPMLTKACDMCEARTAKGKMPSCVQHCQAWCMYYGDVEDLTKKMDGKTRYSLFAR